MLEGCGDGCQMLLKCEGGKKTRAVTKMIPLHMLGGTWLLEKGLETLCKIINFVSMSLLCVSFENGRGE